MDKKDFDTWLENVPEEEPDEIDLAMMREAEEVNDGTTITLEEFMAETRLTGRVNVRMPKSLQRTLIQNAKKEGVSLNQYVVYSLTKHVNNPQP